MIPAAIIALFTAPLFFWGFISILTIAFFCAAAAESLSSGLFLLFLAGCFGVVQAGSIAAAISFVVSNWIFFAGGILALCPISVLWARFRWSLFTTDRLNEIKEKIEEVGRENAAKHFGRYEHVIKQILDSNFLYLTPKVRDNKARIIAWIALCIPDAIWFLIHDPITRFANWAYRAIREWFQGAADEKFKNGFKSAPSVEATEIGTIDERR